MIDTVSRTAGGPALPAREHRFRVWAPLAHQVELHLVQPQDRLLAMSQREKGYWEIGMPLDSGARYFFRIDGGPDRPDPASRSQPDGVHGPSATVESAFDWTDESWRGIPLDEYVLYELHVGTFTTEGTFDAIIPRIPYLQELGVTVLELMPIAQFSGRRNWGYDGVYPFAAQNSYGGVAGLKRLVDACHAAGLAV